ncbi:MAG: hypothetical protein WC775_05460 [Patescibacteria group bacterium]|jgi:hypothetical protein
MNEGEQAQTISPTLEVDWHKKGDILERTVGRLFSIPENIMSATPLAFLDDSKRENIGALEEKYKDIPFQGQVKVYLNHSSFFDQMKRLFSSERRTSILYRGTLGLLETVGLTLWGKLARLNAYNAATESVQIYHPEKAIAISKIESAKIFSDTEHPTLLAIAQWLPFVNTVIAWKSRKEALKRLGNDSIEEQNKANKILSSRVGSDIGRDIAAYIGGVGLGQIILSAASLPWLGALAGYISARNRNPELNKITTSKASAEQT